MPIQALQSSTPYHSKDTHQRTLSKSIPRIISTKSVTTDPIIKAAEPDGKLIPSLTRPDFAALGFNKSTIAPSNPQDNSNVIPASCARPTGPKQKIKSLFNAPVLLKRKPVETKVKSVPKKKAKHASISGAETAIQAQRIDLDEAEDGEWNGRGEWVPSKISHRPQKEIKDNKEGPEGTQQWPAHALRIMYMHMKTAAETIEDAQRPKRRPTQCDACDIKDQGSSRPPSGGNEWRLCVQGRYLYALSYDAVIIFR